MWKYLKSIFDAQVDTTGLLAEDTEIPFGVSVDGTARLRQMKNGKYRLLVNTNEVVGTYARRRDAIRGAERKGLTVIGEA